MSEEVWDVGLSQTRVVLRGRREEERMARPMADMSFAEENAAPMAMLGPSMMVFQPLAALEVMMISRLVVGGVVAVVENRLSGVVRSLERLSE